MEHRVSFVPSRNAGRRACARGAWRIGCRNLEAKVPADRWGEFKAQAWSAYTAASPALAALLREQVLSAWQATLPTAVSCFPR